MRSVLSLLALFVCAASADAQEASRAPTLLQEGEAYLRLHDYEIAAGRFEQSYNWQPDFKAAFQAGYCHFKLKRFSEAELWLDKARRLNPDDEEATVYLASAQIANYKPGIAIALLEEFVRNHPDAPQAVATLAAIRSDLGTQRRSARSISVFQLITGSVLALSLFLYFASLRAHNPGIREVGKGLGLVALTSFYMLSPFPLLLGLCGYGWAGYKFYRGYNLYSYLRKEGPWATLLRSQIFKLAGAFVAVRGEWDEARVDKVLSGLLKAGMDRRTVAEVESQLRVSRPGKPQSEGAVERFRQADEVIREILLRLLVGMALELGYGPSEQQLLGNLASALRLGHRLADILAELGSARKEPAASAADPNMAPSADPLLVHFRILGISPSASRSEVKSGFRKQAKRYHPDVISHLGVEIETVATDRFRKVKRAYETICKAKGWDA